MSKSSNTHQRQGIPAVWEKTEKKLFSGSFREKQRDFFVAEQRSLLTTLSFLHSVDLLMKVGAASPSLYLGKPRSPVLLFPKAIIADDLDKSTSEFGPDHE